MEQIVFYIALCLLLPIGLLCFYLDHRTRRIMLSVAFGVLACLLSFYFNNTSYEILGVSRKYYVTTFAPIIEELFKSIPVIIVVFGLKKGLRGSIANSFAVGVGFCVVENFFYLVDNIDTANIGWIIARCVGTGLMHSMSAVIIGLGFYYARNDKNLKFIEAITSIFVAFIYHGTYNLLVESSMFKVVGAAMPFVMFLLLFIFMKKKKQPDESGASQQE